MQALCTSSDAARLRSAQLAIFAKQTLQPSPVGAVAQTPWPSSPGFGHVIPGAHFSCLPPRKAKECATLKTIHDLNLAFVWTQASAAAKNASSHGTVGPPQRQESIARSNYRVRNTRGSGNRSPQATGERFPRGRVRDRSSNQGLRRHVAPIGRTSASPSERARTCVRRPITMRSALIDHLAHRQRHVVSHGERHASREGVRDRQLWSSARWTVVSRRAVAGWLPPITTRGSARGLSARAYAVSGTSPVTCCSCQSLYDMPAPFTFPSTRPFTLLPATTAAALTTVGSSSTSAISYKRYLVDLQGRSFAQPTRLRLPSLTRRS